jgi:hypothetical protein
LILLVSAFRLAHELVRVQMKEELEDLRAAKIAEWEAGAEARAKAEQDLQHQLQHGIEVKKQEQIERKAIIAAYR